MSTPPNAPRPLVIIPAFNEFDALPAVLADLSALDPPVDVVVVDDGSTDDTAEVARDGRAAVVCLPYNLGIGGALRTWFRYAVRHGYTRALQFDGDGQHDPAAVATLLAELDAGADLVIGSRFADPGGDYDPGAARGWAMGLLRLLVRVLTGRRFSDTSSGSRAFSSAMLEYFAEHYPVEYMESVEALVMACGAGFDVREVPVKMRPRQGGEPSTRRLRLLYHFARVLLVMGVSKGALRGHNPAADARHDLGGSRS